MKHDFSANWHLVVGVLNQISDRNINTAVNQLIDNSGNYKSYLANSFSSLAPRFHVDSDLAYLTGRFKPGSDPPRRRVRQHRLQVRILLAGHQPRQDRACARRTLRRASARRTSRIRWFLSNLPGGHLFLCKDQPIDRDLRVEHHSSAGIQLRRYHHAHSTWLVRVAASQDWTWTDSYTDTAATGFLRTPIPGGYVSQGVSPSASVMFKPRADMTIYATFADSIQAPDVAAANSGNIVIINASQALPPYRSKEGEIGYKLRVRRINFSTALFRVERPFANFVTGVVRSGLRSSIRHSELRGLQDHRQPGQLRRRERRSPAGSSTSLMVTGGLSVLDPKLTNTGIAATNNRNFVGIPDYKSNILAEYRLPVIVGAFLNFDWQHVGRRPIDDINSAYTPQYNTFDFGVRYTTKILGKVTTWRVTANNATNVHYWSTLGPGSITGQSTGSYLGHLGEPRLITASMRFDF